MSRIPEFLEKALYGRAPSELPQIQSEILEEGIMQNGGTRRQIKITLTRGGRTTSFGLLLMLPPGSGPHPVVLSPNLNGLHSVTDDQSVMKSIVPFNWYLRLGMPTYYEARGMKKHRFPMEKIIESGRGAATFFYEEAEPDSPWKSGKGIRALYPESDWGALSAWAWCLSRALDVLIEQSGVDMNRITLYGFSRGGKAVLLAGADDERFSGVIAEASGKAGAALSKHKSGEPLPFMEFRFPHWFSRAFSRFVWTPNNMKEDQDALLASIAPRPLCISIGEKDWWSDVEGTRQAVESARISYKGNTPHFIIREGRHEPRSETWEEYFKFLNAVGQ